jgi:glucose-6-phosphate isomerase
LEKINALLQGEIVNYSENKPALHSALRVQQTDPIHVNGHNIIPAVLQTRTKMQEISEAIRQSAWTGFSGKPIRDIVNIGIGGSDLGPRFYLYALKNYVTPNLKFHFISDSDPQAFSDTVASLNPETTLFIISSKSFTTKETIYNAGKAFLWLGNLQNRQQQVIAITAYPERAQAHGIHHILPIWDWVGGRFSACSAINLITAIAIGFEQFSQLLMGANHMDNHFRETDFKSNLPVLLALIGIWNNNFLGIHNLLILTYSRRLDFFVNYIQQLDMESNGKSIDNQGNAVNYATVPIIWGGPGNQAQHSYYQLLCQGTHKIAADFITLSNFQSELINAFCRDKQHVLVHGVVEPNNPSGFIPGNVPLNHIELTDCSPYSIGALTALYEHKTYTQSVIWNINAFDQPAIESAKRNSISFNPVKDKQPEYQSIDL